MTKIEFLQALAKGWFGNSQQHSMISPHGDFEKNCFCDPCAFRNPCFTGFSEVHVCGKV